MQNFMNYQTLIILCLTVGLSPFFPPHLFEKLIMLKKGTLKKPIDIFDLVLHSFPFVLLGYKLVQDYIL